MSTPFRAIPHTTVGSRGKQITRADAFIFPSKWSKTSIEIAKPPSRWTKTSFEMAQNKVMRLKGPFNVSESNDGVDLHSSDDAIPSHLTEGDHEEVIQGQYTTLELRASCMDGLFGHLRISVKIEKE